LTGQSVAFYKSRWAQASDRRQIGRGVGLGLAIVSRYAELLCAQFTLEPAAPQGGLCAALLFVGES
jgi:two-component system sensor histidine kinase TctE